MINIKISNRFLICILAFLIIVFALASCSNNSGDKLSDSDNSSDVIEDVYVKDTLKVGYTGFSYVFNPFFAETENDIAVIEMTSVRLLTYDKAGNIILSGKTGTVDNDGFKYNGISDININHNENGTVSYVFSLRNNVKFSDGHLLNADDLIFTFYVLLDNSYDGYSTLSTLPVIGLNEYKNGSAKEITGIEKTDEYTVSVSLEYYDVADIDKFDIFVAPLHYYGDESLYSYESQSFGFNKGDISSIKNIQVPFGAGPYVYDCYNNKTIHFTANANYYKAKIEIPYVEFCEIDESVLIDMLTEGEIDVCVPQLKSSIIDSLLNINGGVLNGDILSTYATNKSGYVYMGINANSVLIGEDKASVESKYLRKAFATVFASFRLQCIDEYCGGLYDIVNFPNINNANVTKINEEIYTKYLDGSDFSYSGISNAERQSYAMLTAIEFLKAAGFVYDESTGKFTNAPNGTSLTYNVAIGGISDGDHPAYAIFANAKNVFSSFGITLNLVEPANSSELMSLISGNQCDMWIAAWDDFNIKTFYQLYHSDNVNKSNGSSDTNIFGIEDENLDNTIIALINADENDCQKLLNECYGYILDWAIEVPICNRVNCIVFSNVTVNTSAIGESDYKLHNWIDCIDKLEFVKQ